MSETEATTTAPSTPTDLPPRIVIDRDRVMKVVQTAIASVEGVIPIENANAFHHLLPHEHQVAIDVGRSALSVRVTIGATYPGDLVELCNNVRAAVTEALRTEEKVEVRRVSVNIAHLQHVDRVSS